MLRWSSQSLGATESDVRLDAWEECDSRYMTDSLQEFFVGARVGFAFDDFTADPDFENKSMGVKL